MLYTALNSDAAPQTRPRVRRLQHRQPRVLQTLVECAPVHVLEDDVHGALVVEAVVEGHEPREVLRRVQRAQLAQQRQALEQRLQAASLSRAPRIFVHLRRGERSCRALPLETSR